MSINGIIGGIWSPASYDSTPNIIIMVLAVIVFLFVIGIISYCLWFRKPKDNEKINKDKKEPAIFENEVNHDITILATDKYSEISVQLSLYNNKQLIKEFIVKELNFEQNEQRVIGNINDYKAEQIRYKIVGYK